MGAEVESKRVGGGYAVGGGGDTRSRLVLVSCYQLYHTSPPQPSFRQRGKAAKGGVGVSNKMVDKLLDSTVLWRWLCGRAQLLMQVKRRR